MAATAEKKAKAKATVSQASSHKESAAEIADIFRSVKKNKNNKRKEVENPSSNSNVKTTKKKKDQDDKKGNLGESTANSNKNKKKEKEVKNKDEDRDEGFSPEKNKRRRTTNDGLTIYSAEELGFGKSDAGGTPLCPFDCSCCF